MTQDEIIRMAREVGCDNYGDCYEFVPETLERFAALVAAHEREAIAEVLDGIGAVYETEGLNGTKSYHGCAAAIRARGEK